MLTICSPNKEAGQIWPNCKIDIALHYGGGTYDKSLVVSAAHKLIASLFYIELEEKPRLRFNGRTWTAILIRCRLPSGPKLADLIATLRSRATGVYYYGDESVPNKAELCRSSSWNEVKTGKRFRRLLYVRVSSLSTPVGVAIDGASGGLTSISNCPCTLGTLVNAVPHHVTEPDGFTDQFEHLSSQLRHFIL